MSSNQDLTDEEDQRLVELNQQYQEYSTRATNPNPAGTEQFNKQQMEEYRQKAEAIRPELESLKARANPEQVALLESGSGRGAFQSEAVAVGFWGGNILPESGQYHYSSSPAEKADQETLANIAKYYPYAPTSKVISFFRGEGSEQELAQVNAQAATTLLGHTVEPQQTKGFSRSMKPMNNTSINFEATLAARKEGLNVGSGIVTNLEPTFQKDWNKQFAERNKILNLYEGGNPLISKPTSTTPPTVTPQNPRKRIQENQPGKLYGNPKQESHPLIQDKEKTNIHYNIALNEGGKTPTNYVLSLTEGGPQEKARLTPEQKQANIKNTLNIKKFVKSAQEAKAPFVILEIGGQKKTVPTDQAFRFYVEAARSGKEITLSTPTMISLTEDLSMGEGKLSVTGYKQDKAGHIETILAQAKTPPKQYDVNQIIPLSIQGNELTGITRGRNAGELVTFDFTPEKKLVYQNEIVTGLNTGQKWIADLERISKERLKKNPNDALGKVGLTVGSFGKEFYNIAPFGYNVITELMPPTFEPSGKKKEFEKATVPQTSSTAAMEDISKLRNPFEKGSSFERYTKGLTPEQKLGEATGFIVPLAVTGAIRGAEELTLFTKQALGVAKSGERGVITDILEKIRPLSPLGKAKTITRALDPQNIYGVEAVQPLKTVGKIESAITTTKGIIEKTATKIKEPFTAKPTATTLEPTALTAETKAVEPPPIEVTPIPEVPTITPTPTKPAIAGLSPSVVSFSQIAARVAAITRKGGTTFETNINAIKGRIFQPSRYTGYLGIEGGAETATKATKKPFDFEITRQGKKKSIKPKETIVPTESKTPAVMIDTGKKGLTGIVRSEPMKEIANQMGVIVSGDIGKVDVKRLGLKLISKKGETPLFAARLPEGAKERTEFLLRIGEAEKLGYITRVTDIEFLPTKEALKYSKIKNVRTENPNPLDNILGNEKARRYAVKVAPFYEAKQVLGATREIKVKGIEKPLSVEEAFKQGKLPKGETPYDVELGKVGFDKYLTDIGLSKGLEPSERASKIMRGFEDFTKPFKESKGFAGSEGKARAISKEKALDIAKQISPLTKGVRETQKPIAPNYGMAYSAVDSSAGMFESQVSGRYNISPYQEKRLEITEPRLDTGTSINARQNLESSLGLKQPSILSSGLKQITPQKNETGLRINTITKAGLKEQEKLRTDLLSRLKIENVLRSDTQSKLRVSEVQKLATVQKQELVTKIIPRIREKEKEKLKGRVVPFTFPKIKERKTARSKEESISRREFIGNAPLESVVGLYPKFDIKYGGKSVSKQEAFTLGRERKGSKHLSSFHSNKSPFGYGKPKRIRF